MVIHAKLADGTTLEFPDDTDEAVIDRTVEQQTMQTQAPADTGIPATMFNQGMQGATGGLADEGAALLGSLGTKAADSINRAMGGEGYGDIQQQSYGDLFNQGMNSQNNQIKQQQAEHPVFSAASQLGGGIATVLAGAATAPGKALASRLGAGSAEQQLSKAALAGTAAGEGYSATTAEGDLGERGQAALEALPLNAVLGSAVPLALPAVKAGAQVVKNATVGNSAEKLLENSVNKGVGEQALDASGDVVQNAGTPVERLQQLRNDLAGSGDNTLLADVGGDEVKGLMRLVGRQSGGPKELVSSTLYNRSNAAGRRIDAELSKSISPVDTYFGNLDDVAAARSKAASPLYDNAYKSNPTVVSPVIDRILETPAGKSALKEASVIMQNDMSRLATPSKELAEQARLVGEYVPGSGGIGEGLNLRSLDYVKKALDKQINAGLLAKDPNTGILIDLKKNLVKELDAADTTGDYAKARKIFSDSKSLDNAQEFGATYNNLSPEEITRFVKDATPGELDAFRIGVRKNLSQSVLDTSKGGDPAKKLIGSDWKSDKLAAVFGNDRKGYADFTKRMTEEINAADTKFKVLGGSRTDINLAEDGSALVEAGINALKDGKLDLAKKAMSAVAHGLHSRYIGLNKQNADTLAKILTNKERSLELLDRLIAKNTDAVQKEALQEARDELPGILGRVRLSEGTPLVRIQATRVNPNEEK